ncbi:MULTISPECIES: hypothetical protein [unclassified Providencia]|uniref:hypothetical protein n=1 Tax=unclassified Providencia TaxID=2633465 RepID=UPI00234BD264|nr:MULTISPECIES: hypothetical protein [unclassified Providencia]
MRKIITTIIQNHKYYYQPQKPNKNFITDNIKSIKSKNNDELKFHQSSHKKEYKFNVDVPYITSKEKKTDPIIEKQKPITPVNTTKLEDIKNIDSFVRRIREKNIYFEAKDNNDYVYQGSLNSVGNEKTSDLYLNITNSLGHGTYGTAYRVGNFVIKVPFYDVYKISPYSKVKRCSSILNELNENINFSRAITLNKGKDVLITKYIAGKNIKGNSAYDFVKQKGRIMFDYNSNGNVKMDNNRKKYVIDADFVAQATELKKYPSLETLMIREIYTNIYIEKPLEANEIKPLYYSEIENLLPKLEKK